MAVLVRYATGATMTYHLTAYAPWEGYRVMVNGSQGRLELEVVESDHVSPAAAGGSRAPPCTARRRAGAGRATLTSGRSGRRRARCRCTGYAAAGPRRRRRRG